jgi:peptidoglycan/xylan/chitin deacetylase (PgdA/CDA1 family)
MSALILTYHRIRLPDRDPLLQCVDPERFADHLSCLSRLAEIVPLRELLEPARGRRVALTFDDGYADNAAAAVPALRTAGAPGTFFVPSRILDDPSEFWWDRLEHIHLDLPLRGETVDVAPGGRRVRIDVRTETGRLRSLKALGRRLRPLPGAAIDSIVADVCAQLGAPHNQRCDSHALMSRADVEAVASDPLFEIGSHTVTHVMLAAISREKQDVELRRSREALAAVADKPVRLLAYPFGTAGSFTAETMAAAEAAGYELACANTPGPIDRRRGRYSLPRHMVYDWTADELEEHVTSWFASL